MDFKDLKTQLKLYLFNRLRGFSYCSNEFDLWKKWQPPPFEYGFVKSTRRIFIIVSNLTDISILWKCFIIASEIELFWYPQFLGSSSSFPNAASLWDENSCTNVQMYKLQTFSIDSVFQYFSVLLFRETCPMTNLCWLWLTNRFKTALLMIYFRDWSHVETIL